MMRKVEYRFGRVYCQTGGSPIPEGPITDSKIIKEALDTLEIERSWRHPITWIGDDSHKLVRTEEQADRLIEYLQTHFGESVRFAGVKPVDCYHGKIFFSKTVQVEIDFETTYGEISKALARSLGVEPGRISEIAYPR